jgi:streptogramin lyase
MPSSGIFISYRREDAAGHAGWLRDGLAAHFGEDEVFMDLGLEPGVDFVEQIEAGISGCAAMLAVIGPEWLTVTAADGGRRLEDEGDFVRLEIATAIARPGLRVIPILVNGARVPDAEELPDDLKPLARRQAIELTNARWKYDVSRLIATLERVLATRAAPLAGQQPDRIEEPAPDEPAPEEVPAAATPVVETLPKKTRSYPRRRLAIAAGVAAAVVIAVLVVAGVLGGGGGAIGDESGGGGTTDESGAENVVELTAGSGPDDIALDAKSVWVTEDDRGKLARISRASGRLITEDLDLGGDADGVDTGAGSVWAVSTGENRVRQFRPGTPAPLTETPVQPGPKGIAVGPDDVWVVNSKTDQLTRIGLPDATVKEVIAVGNDPRDVALGAPGIVWVANVKDRSVTRIDLDGDPQYREDIAVGGRPRDLAKDSRGNIWVAIADRDEVLRIGPADPAGERPMKRIAVGARPSGLAISDGLVWVTNTDAGTVTVLEERSGDTVGDPIPVGEQPVGIAADGDTAWVTNYGDDTVSKISVASAR